MRTGSVKLSVWLLGWFVGDLSVSSMRTGSVKHGKPDDGKHDTYTFSVLDADRFGETRWWRDADGSVSPFSVLDADRFGETHEITREEVNECLFQCPRCGPVR